jgi:SOS-response transcriptional repressor LexA
MSDLSLSQSLSAQSTSTTALGLSSASKSAIQELSRVTLDELLIPKPVSTIIYPVRSLSAAHYGLKLGDLLIVDREAVPNLDQLVIVLVNDELVISRHLNHSIQTHSKVTEAIDNVTNLHIFGVVTYIICKQ